MHTHTHTHVIYMTIMNLKHVCKWCPRWFHQRCRSVQDKSLVDRSHGGTAGLCVTSWHVTSLAFKKLIWRTIHIASTTVRSPRMVGALGAKCDVPSHQCQT